jgi:hypothetical protein
LISALKPEAEKWRLSFPGSLPSGFHWLAAAFSGFLFSPFPIAFWISAHEPGGIQSKKPVRQKERISKLNLALNKKATIKFFCSDFFQN